MLILILFFFFLCNINILIKDAPNDSDNPINIYMTVSTFSTIKPDVHRDGSVVVQKYDWTSLNPQKPLVRLSTNASLTCQYLLKPG